MARTAFRTCPLCEAGCGLEITLRDREGGGEEVVRIRGDQDDVFSKGFLCPKGSTLKQLHEDPDRLRRPLVKRDGVHVEATWDEAFAEIEARLLPIIAEHGRDACAAYLGNPSAHNLGALLYGRAVLRALGTKNLFSASTVDQRPKEISAALMFGGALNVPVPDVDRTDHLLMLGANPFAAHDGQGAADHGCQFNHSSLPLSDWCCTLLYQTRSAWATLSLALRLETMRVMWARSLTSRSTS